MDIVKDLTRYLNHTLKDVLEYPEDYHVSIDIQEEDITLVLTSTIGFSTISDIGFTDDPNGVRINFEERIIEYIKKKFNVKNVNSITYDIDVIVINFQVDQSSKN